MSSPPPDVAIVYGVGCPNLRLARRRVRAALQAAGSPLRWREWDRDSPRTPAFARGHGSPTVLVGRRDVAPEFRGKPGTDEAGRWPDRCRLYPNGEGALDGAPPLGAIVEAIRAAQRSATRSEHE